MVYEHIATDSCVLCTTTKSKCANYMYRSQHMQNISHICSIQMSISLMLFLHFCMFDGFCLFLNFFFESSNTTVEHFISAIRYTVAYLYCRRCIYAYRLKHIAHCCGIFVVDVLHYFNRVFESMCLFFYVSVRCRKVFLTIFIFHLKIAPCKRKSMEMCKK